MTTRIVSLCGLVLTVASFCWAEPPLFTIGSVPPQQVVQGDTLQFVLASPRNGAASFSYAVDPGYPSPQGTVALDSGTGLVSYSPAPADKFQFSLRFTSRVAGQPED